MMQQRTPIAIAWGVIGVFVIADLILFSVSRLSFADSSAQHVVSTAMMVAVLFAVAPLTRYRLGSDQSATARFLVDRADGVGLLAHAVACIIALGLVGVTFSYLSTSLAWPLRDAELAAIDKALGFDWPAFLAWTNSKPLIASVFQYAYHSSGLQLIALVLLLSLARKPERLWEFIAILALTSLLTAIGMTLLPAEGAYAFYDPPSAAFSNYSPETGMWHHSTLVALRTEANPILDFGATQGLVTFPSFHTVLAIITTYAVRGWRWLFIPTLVLNAIVVLGTITEGGHHLVDIIVGAVIAAVSIAAVRVAMTSRDRSRISPALQKGLQARDHVRAA